MKTICYKNNIPTAGFKICKNLLDVNKFLKNCNLPVVVKADGLAAGKGVSICDKKKQVINISSEIFKGKFKSSKKVVLEEFLDGEEASYFIVVDNNSLNFLGVHKITNVLLKMIKGLTLVEWVPMLQLQL